MRKPISPRASRDRRAQEQGRGSRDRPVRRSIADKLVGHGAGSVEIWSAGTQGTAVGTFTLRISTAGCVVWHPPEPWRVVYDAEFPLLRRWSILDTGNLPRPREHADNAYGGRLCSRSGARACHLDDGTSRVRRRWIRK